MFKTKREARNVKGFALRAFVNINLSINLFR